MIVFMSELCRQVTNRTSMSRIKVSIFSYTERVYYFENYPYKVKSKLSRMEVARAAVANSIDTSYDDGF